MHAKSLANYGRGRENQIRISVVALLIGAELGDLFGACTKFGLIM